MRKKNTSIAALIVVLLLGVCLCACTSASQDESAARLNKSIDHVSLPEKGSVSYDFKSTDEESGLTSRIVAVKGISMGESKSYAKSLVNQGFLQLYEDTASEDFFGFSSILEGGVCISGAWTEDVLTLSVTDAATAQAMLDQDAAAHEGDDGSDS